MNVSEAVALPVSSPHLSLVIATDKEEYRLGESINATFYISNSLPHAVRIPLYPEYSYSGSGDPEPNVVCSTDVDWPAHVTALTIPALSMHKVHQAPLIPAKAGNYTIRFEIWGRKASLTVEVLES